MKEKVDDFNQEVNSELIGKQPKPTMQERDFHVLEYIAWDGNRWEAAIKVDNGHFNFEHHRRDGDRNIIESRRSGFITYIAYNREGWRAYADFDSNAGPAGITFLHCKGNGPVDHHNPILWFLDWEGKPWQATIIGVSKDYVTFSLRKIN